MHRQRITRKLFALVGLVIALTFGGAALLPTVASAQYDGYDGYEGEDPTADCPPGYEGYAGYEGCGEDGTGGETPGETAAPPATGGGTLPNTGGIALVGAASAAAVAGLALRRLTRS